MGGGAPLHHLQDLRRDYPVSLHGVGLSLGGADGLDEDHLKRIRSVAERIEPALVSDHLSWSVGGGAYLVDLLPLPLTEEALAVVCGNVARFQDFMGRRILIENPSSYLRYRHSTIPEWEFIAAVARRTGCGILCDVNNIYVSSVNHGWDATVYLEALTDAPIGEIHLAGHSTKILDDGVTILIDDHGSEVIPPVWDLYSQAIARFGAVPTLIERDTNIPPLEELVAEADRAEVVLERARQDRDADAA